MLWAHLAKLLREGMRRKRKRLEVLGPLSPLTYRCATVLEEKTTPPSGLEVSPLAEIPPVSKRLLGIIFN
jgi:hypothetical protein